MVTMRTAISAHGVRRDYVDVRGTRLVFIDQLDQALDAVARYSLESAQDFRPAA